MPRVSLQQSIVRLAALLLFVAVFASPDAVGAQSGEPLGFIENMGQREAGIDYYVQGARLAIDLSGQRATLITADGDEATAQVLSYVGSSTGLTGEGDDRLLDARVYAAENPNNPRTGVGVYESVRYSGLYADIDLTYSGMIGTLKREFEVAPGADPAEIRMRYEGLTPAVAPDGSLRLMEGADLRFTESIPLAYQQVNDLPLAVDVDYEVQPDGSVGFALGDVDASKALTIRVVIDYSGAIDVATEKTIRQSNTDPQSGELVITQISDVLTQSAVLASLEAFAEASEASTDSLASPDALIPPGDLGGGDLLPADGDTLTGTYTNVGLFHVPAGATVEVVPGAPLIVMAEEIRIEGSLDGTGGGFLGGPNPAPNAAGVAGQGPGGGGGGLIGSSIHGPGGGGGGYGGAGGGGGRTLTTPAEAPGGLPYGSANPPGIQPGSGGGSAASHTGGNPPALGGFGGNGGAGITLSAPLIDISGAVVADGSDGGPGILGQFGSGLRVSGGGAGSGGGIWLDGCMVLTEAQLSADGGMGGSATGTGGFGTGGGGGGGGRIKLSGTMAPASIYAASAAGGLPGSNAGYVATQDPSPGVAGTVIDQTEPAPCVTLAPAVGGYGMGSIEPVGSPARAEENASSNPLAWFVVAWVAALAAIVLGMAGRRWVRVRNTD